MPVWILDFGLQFEEAMEVPESNSERLTLSPHVFYR